MTAAGKTINEFTLNLSDSLHPCDVVATIVVSDMKDRLSPKKAPPTTIAVISGIFAPVECAKPAAIGVSATIVPTLVPIESDMKQAAINSPARSILPGRRFSVKLTVASMLPISFALFAKAPARTNIHNISIRSPEPAPRLNILIRVSIGYPYMAIIAYILDNINATVIGTL